MSRYSFLATITQRDIDDFRAGKVSCPVAAAMLRKGKQTFRDKKVRVHNGNLQTYEHYADGKGHGYWESWYPSASAHRIAKRCRQFKRLTNLNPNDKLPLEVYPTQFLIGE
tara:strand:+ start:206 stop:538 length:333 start_codon:yes stop_codon:yes gene_type:complete